MKPWSLLWRSMRLIVQAAPKEVGRLAALNIVSAFSPVLLTYLGALTIDRVGKVLSSGLTSTTLMDFLGAHQDLLGLILAMMLLNVFVDALLPIEGFNMDNLRDRVQGQLHLQLMQKISSVHELTLFESPGFARSVKLTDKSLQKLTQLADTLSYCLVGLVSLGAIVALLSQLTWWVPWVIILATVPVIVVQGQLEDLSWSVETKHAESSRKMDVFRRILTRPEFAKDVRVYGYARPLQNKWQNTFLLVLRDMIAVRRQASLKMLGWSLVSGAGTVAPLLFVVHQVAQGLATVGQLSFYVGSIFQIRRSLSTLIFQGGDIFSVLHHVQPLFDVLDFTPIQRGTLPLDSIQTLELQGVSFTYPQASHPSLRNIDFRFEQGKSYALVGQNGAGKTSLIKLLLQFYPPSQGHLLVNGQPLEDFDLDSCLSRISAVFQDHACFPLQVSQNISPLGAEPLTAAALLSDLRIFEGRTLSLEQSLDPEEEGGLDLSGGQWQKLAIARAEHKNGVDLIVLDEPTAALDPVIEHEIFQKFRNMVEDRIGIIVSHRLSLTRSVDVILVLHDGEIIECGSHQQLMELGGHYARMFDLQSSAYLT